MLHFPDGGDFDVVRIHFNRILRVAKIGNFELLENYIPDDTLSAYKTES